MPSIVRKLIFYPNDILRTNCKEVNEINEDIKLLISDMFECIKTFNAVGVSAPQLNIDKRIAVAKIGSEEFVLINPIILESKGEMLSTEGCLSFPDILIDTVRPEYLKIRSLDLEGNEKEFDVQGIYANVLSHEIDHLNGRLFIDDLSLLKKDVIKRKMLKFTRKFLGKRKL